MAEPEQFTKITCLPIFFRSAIHWRCTLGSSILMRSPPLKPSSLTLISSHSRRGDMPPTKMMVFASFISAMISSRLLLSFMVKSNCSMACPVNCAYSMQTGYCRPAFTLHVRLEFLTPWPFVRFRMVSPLKMMRRKSSLSASICNSPSYWARNMPS